MKDLENNEIYAKYQINEDSSKKIEITKKETKRKFSQRNKGKKNSLIIKNKSHIIQMGSFRNNLINKNSENISNLRANNLIENDKKEDKNSKIKKINFSFNIFEVVISLFLRCCMPKKLKLKDNLTSNAKNILYNKLDIVLYIRKMILIDTMYKYLIDDNKKDIINFLSMPKISLYNKKEENDLNSAYLNNYEADFDKFCDKISILSQKSKTEKNEKKLIYLSAQELKKLI